MRARDTYKRYVYYLLPILLFAVVLFGLICTLSPTYAAESFSYITADVTYDGTVESEVVLANTGTELPSALVYRGGAAYNYSFRLYQRGPESADWEPCTDDLASSFSLSYDGSAPTSVGSYTIRVRANKGVAGYKYLNSLNEPTSIKAGDVIAEAAFSIVPESVSLFVPALDEVASPVRSDLLYGIIMTGAKVILGETTLTKDTDYTLTLEQYTTGYAAVTAIDVAGTYRLKVTFANTAATAALARTSLQSPYVICREFTVIDPSTDLALNKTSIYVDDTTTEIQLSSAPSVSYATSLYKEVNVGGTKLYSFVGAEGTHKYKEFEAGNYLYRVTFGADDATLGVKSGDIVDLPFTVKDIPYTVSFRVNGDYALSSVIVDNSAGGDTTYFLVPSFTITDGSAAPNVFMNVAEQKYETSYYKYSSSDWESSISGLGKYKVKVALKSGSANAVQIGNYSIDPGTTLCEKEVVVISGGLRVKANGTFNYTGSDISPLNFVTSSNQSAAELVDGKYTVTYQRNGSAAAAVHDVGHYTFEVKLTEDIDELNVKDGYVYYGEFDVVYPSFGVNYDYDNGSVSISASTAAGTLPLTKGTDYDLIYYSVSNGDLFHKHGDANVTPHPTAVGSYAAMIVFKAAYAVYNVKAGDTAICFIENSETTAQITINAFDLITYDGGVKQPPLTFTKAGETLSLTPNVDYSVTYFKKVGENYEACGYPVYAGTYKCLVTFLKTGASGTGVIRGAYEKRDFVISPRPVKVTRTDKNDFIYDGAAKAVSVDLRVDGRPYRGSSAFSYSLGETPVASPTNVGDYVATLALSFGTDPNAAALAKSYALSASAYTLSIKPLELEVRYTVPTGYDAMYTGDDFAIDVEYIVKKGKYTSSDPVTAEALKDKALLEYGEHLDIEENITYSATPHDPGQYFCYVQSDNANVKLTAASACDAEGEPIGGSVTSLTEGTARLSFTITPCKVEVDFELTSDLYYTGEEKGVESVSFLAYNPTTTEFDRPLSDLGITYAEGVDYYLDYYSYTVNAETGVISHDGEYHSTTKPNKKGKYYARLVFTKDVAADAEEAKYTFVDGCASDGTPLDRIREGAYVDELYAIKVQTDLSAYVSVENEFDGDKFYKVLNLSFILNGNVFDPGITYGTTVSHKGASASTESTSSGLRVKDNDPGTYTVTFTFHRNTAYHITPYNGEYAGANNDYVFEGDTLTYTYTFIEQKELIIGWGLDDITYYDGTAKKVDLSFEKEIETNVNAYVGMIEGTHYSVKYYEKNADNDEYKLMEGEFPIKPGDYIVEIVFMEDLPDYKVQGKVLRPANFTSYEDKGEAATLPRFRFTIEKAVLVITGVSVQDKAFDGTTNATLSGTIALSAKEGFGAIVETPKYTGELLGHFESPIPCAADATIPFKYDEDKTDFFALTEESQAYYTVPEYPALSARITRAIVVVKPKEVRRQYDYSAVDNTVEYTVSCADVILDVFTLSTPRDLVQGDLYRASGITVGAYEILTDRLTWSTKISMPSGEAYAGKNPNHLLELQVDMYDDNGDLIRYHITNRTVTGYITSASKTYKGEDPDTFDIVISSGSFAAGDHISATIARAKGENVGRYEITASDLRVVNSEGKDVSGYYVLTIDKGVFTILPKALVIAPPNQTASYLDGFDPTRIGVIDPSAGNKDVTNDYKETTGDHFIGKLTCTPKKSADGTDDPDTYVIGRGTVRMVNEKGEDVSANYDITFIDEERTYTIAKVTITVNLKADAVLSKYYGDPDPIIPFTITNAELEKLGELTLSKYSSIGRAGRSAGMEDVARCLLCKDNSEGTFVVLDNGKDVTRYFEFNVENVDPERNPKYFEIKPRPIIVAVEDATFENTGVDIRPKLTYLNASGDKLSASLLAKLKVTYAAPTDADFDYQKGENKVSPMIVGDKTSDPNFEIQTREGTITIVYLQDVVTAAEMPKEDPIYSANKNILAGIMLYKPVLFYKLSTANGEQPSEAVDITLPIDAEFKGSGYVAVALYADGSPKAFALTKDGLSLVYQDDGAYYVAIAVAQEWFYIVIGVVLIVAAVGLFFLVRWLVFIIKKYTAMTPEKEAKKAAKLAEQEAKKRAREAAKAAPASEQPQEEPVRSDEVELFIPQAAELPLDGEEIGAEIPQEDEIPVPVEPEETVAPAEETVSVEEAVSDKTLGQSVFIPTAATAEVSEEVAPAALTKEQKKAQREQEKAQREQEKALREQEKAQKKEKERAEKEAKELAKREKEAERARLEMEKKAKKQNAASSGRQMAFIPTGAKPRLSEDYVEEEPMPKDQAVPNVPVSADDEIEIEIPLSDDTSSGDDLVLSRASSMFDDEEEAPKDDEEEL